MKVKGMLVCILLALLVCALYTGAYADRKAAGLNGQVRAMDFSKAVPGQLSYQGFMANAADSSVVDATLEMTFRLFDSETKGAELWSETHAMVEVVGGLFQVLLGSQTAFPAGLFHGSPLWLETEIGTEVLVPRKPLVSAAYSHRANSAEMLLDYTLTDLDDRWINEDQANSITSAMITDSEIVDADVSVTADIHPGKISGTAWTGDNDGAGSGLDADMVDGQHAAALISTADLDHLDAADGDPANAVYVDDDGKVGIGTTSPLTKLDVNGSVNAATYFGDGSNLTGVSGTSDGDWTISGSDLYSGVSGNIGIGTAVPAEKLHVNGAIYCTDSLVVNSPTRYGVKITQADKMGIYVKSAGVMPPGTYWTNPCGYEVAAAEEYGYYAGDVGRGGMRVYEVGSPSDDGATGLHNGYEVRAAQGCGFVVGHSDSAGVYVNSTNNHGVVVVEPEKSGYYVSSAGQHGVYVDSAKTDGVNIRDTGDDGVAIYYTKGDGIYISYPGESGIEIWRPNYDGILISRSRGRGMYVYYSDDDGVRVYSAGEDGGYFDLADTSAGWAVYAHSTGLTGKGIYCHGDGTITGSWSKTIPTSKGWEAVRTLSAPDDEIVASGTARLVDGRCRVEFERLFREAISHRIPVKIVLTSMDRWSGLYTTERSHEGFTVLAGAGAQDVEFTWQAIGRRQGYEQRPIANIPDPDVENALLEAEAKEQWPEEERMDYSRKTSRRTETKVIRAGDGSFMELVNE